MPATPPRPKEFGPDSPCVEWAGARTRAGYGHRKVRGRTVSVHRLAWQETHGPIPDGMVVCHRCDNRPCINVDHLFLGTQADNIRDMYAKGRRSQEGEENNSAKLTEEQVIEIRRLHATGQVTQRQLARQFGAAAPTVNEIIKRKLWRSC